MRGSAGATEKVWVRERWEEKVDDTYDPEEEKDKRVRDRQK